MKKMIFAPHGLFSPEREILHSIAITSLIKGDFVEVVYCKQGHCSMNPLGIKALCKLCYRKNKQLSDTLIKSAKTKENLKISFYESLPKNKLNLDTEIKNTKYKGEDLGYAVLSTYIGVTRDFQPDIKNKPVQKVLIGLASNFQDTYDYLVSKFENESYDEFHVFNGRLNNSRAALRAAQKCKLTSYAHELVGLGDKVQTFINCLPHDLHSNQNKINHLYQKNIANSEELARDFYTKKRNGQAVVDKSYVSKQKQELPEGWSSEKRNITLFTSSEDEFKAIGKEWEGGVFPDQIEAIKGIINCLDASKDMLYVRVHPNVQHAAEKYLKSIMSLKHPCLNLISPTSKVSSYLLMDNSDIVITCGSTIGIEAAYWGKVSILLTSSFYKNLGSTYEPLNFTELKELLGKKELKPLPNIGAIKLGVFYKQNGEPLEGFKGEKGIGYSYFGNKISNNLKEKAVYNYTKTFQKFYVENFLK